MNQIIITLSCTFNCLTRDLLFRYSSLIALQNSLEKNTYHFNKLKEFLQKS